MLESYEYLGNFIEPFFDIVVVLFLFHCVHMCIEEVV